MQKLSFYILKSWDTSRHYYRKSNHSSIFLSNITQVLKSMIQNKTKQNTLILKKSVDNMMSLLLAQCQHHSKLLPQVLANLDIVTVVQGDLRQNLKCTERTGSILSFELLSDSTEIRPAKCMKSKHMLLRVEPALAGNRNDSKLKALFFLTVIKQDLIWTSMCCQIFSQLVFHFPRISQCKQGHRSKSRGRF